MNNDVYDRVLVEMPIRVMQFHFSLFTLHFSFFTLHFSFFTLHSKRFSSPDERNAEHPHHDDNFQEVSQKSIMYLGASLPEYWQKAPQKDDGCQNKVVFHTARVRKGCQKVDAHKGKTNEHSNELLGTTLPIVGGDGMVA